MAGSQASPLWWVCVLVQVWRYRRGPVRPLQAVATSVSRFFVRMRLSNKAQVDE
jgi:hypothetical protein